MNSRISNKLFALAALAGLLAFIAIQAEAGGKGGEENEDIILYNGNIVMRGGGGGKKGKGGGGSIVLANQHPKTEEIEFAPSFFGDAFGGGHGYGGGFGRR